MARIVVPPPRGPLFAAHLVLLILAVPLAAQQIDLDAVEAADRFRSGVQLYHRGAFQASILALERSLTLKPEETLVRTWLAQANYRAGYVSAALRGWRDLIDRRIAESAILQNRLQYATWRHGLGPELDTEPTWVLAYEIRSRRGETSVFRRPVTVHALRDGNLAIVSFATNQLVVVDVNGTVLRTLKGGLYGLDRPYDLMPTGDGGWVVSELGGRRVVRLNAGGNRVSVFSGTPGGLVAPQYLATDAAGNVYLTDAATNRVRKYDPQGAWLLDFGVRLAEPTGIAVRGDEVFVAERGAKRISVFDLSGNALATLGEGQLAAPEGLTFWDENTLLVADTTRLLAGDVERDRWRPWGSLDTRAKRLTSVSQDAGGMLYVTDMDAEVVYVLTRQANLVVGNNVSITRIGSEGFPTVDLAVRVEDRYGRPLTGLKPVNFLLYETGLPVTSFRVIRTPVDDAPLEIVLVVDQSPAVAGREAELRTAALALYDELARAGGLSVVAGETPVVVSPPGTTRLRMAQAVAAPEVSARWRLDTALRVAANELAAGWGRKAVVYLTAGGAGVRPFEGVSLSEATAALINDGVSFHVVTLSQEAVAEELDYLARTTGGSVVAVSNPRGVTGLALRLAEIPSPIYLLRYTTDAFGDFGRRYLTVRVEVVLPGPTGGDTTGYFAPVQR